MPENEHHKHHRDKGNFVDRNTLKVGEEKLREIWGILEKLDAVRELLAKYSDITDIKKFLDYIAENGDTFKTNADNIDAINSVAMDLNGLHSYCGWIKAPATNDRECEIVEDGSSILSYTDLRYRVLFKENNLSDVSDKQEAVDNLGIATIETTGD